MPMRVDEINAAGGLNGRKLNLLIEDHGYDRKQAVHRDLHQAALVGRFDAACGTGVFNESDDGH